MTCFSLKTILPPPPISLFIGGLSELDPQLGTTLCKWVRDDEFSNVCRTGL